MAVLRTDIERALDELKSQEAGMRFQELAVVLGKQHWPELRACERKKEFGLDVYAPASLTPDKICKGLAASITARRKKISDDAKTCSSRKFHPSRRGLPNSLRTGTEDAGSRARTRENLGGAIGRLEFGPLRPPSSPVYSWSVETIPMDLDGEGDERARYATRL